MEKKTTVSKYTKYGRRRVKKRTTFKRYKQIVYPMYGRDTIDVQYELVLLYGMDDSGNLGYVVGRYTGSNVANYFLPVGTTGTPNSGGAFQFPVSNQSLMHPIFVGHSYVFNSGKTSVSSLAEQLTRYKYWKIKSLDVRMRSMYSGQIGRLQSQTAGGYALNGLDSATVLPDLFINVCDNIGLGNNGTSNPFPGYPTLDRSTFTPKFIPGFPQRAKGSLCYNPRTAAKDVHRTFVFGNYCFPPQYAYCVDFASGIGSQQVTVCSPGHWGPTSTYCQDDFAADAIPAINGCVAFGQYPVGVVLPAEVNTGYKGRFNLVANIQLVYKIKLAGEYDNNGGTYE